MRKESGKTGQFDHPRKLILSFGIAKLWKDVDRGLLTKEKITFAIISPCHHRMLRETFVFAFKPIQIKKNHKHYYTTMIFIKKRVEKENTWHIPDANKQTRPEPINLPWHKTSPFQEQQSNRFPKLKLKHSTKVSIAQGRERKPMISYNLCYNLYQCPRATHSSIIACCCPKNISK